MARVFTMANTEFLRKGQVGPVTAEVVSNVQKAVPRSEDSRSGLVPALNGGTDRTDDNRNVKSQRVLPFMIVLLLEKMGLLVGETLDLVPSCRILGNQRALLQVFGEIDDVFIAGEFFNISHQDIVRNIGKRIGDPKGLLAFHGKALRGERRPASSLGVEILSKVKRGDGASAPLASNGLLVVNLVLCLELLRHFGGSLVQDKPRKRGEISVGENEQAPSSPRLIICLSAWRPSQSRMRRT